MQDQHWQLIKVTVVGIAVLGLSIEVILVLLPVSVAFKEGLITEVVGSGIIGMVLILLAAYLQESGNQLYQVRRAKSFLNYRLIPDILEAFDRSPSSYRIGSGKEFYFDATRINNLYDIFDRHITLITQYGKVLPRNKLLPLCQEFYFNTRVAYVLAEKLDRRINEIIRKIHYKQDKDPINDLAMAGIAKAKLYADIPDDVVKEALHLREIFDGQIKIMTSINSDPDFQIILGQVAGKRNELHDLSESFVRLIEASG